MLTRRVVGSTLPHGRFWHTPRVTKNTSDFWMAIATVLPVLGLALLLVTRSQLVHSLERKLPLASALFPFIICLPGVVVVELIALNALLNPTATNVLLETVAMMVVALHVGLLFMSPLVSLIYVTYGHWFAEPRTVLAMRRAKRGVRRNLREMRRTRRTLERLIVRSTNTLARRAVAFREKPFDPGEPVWLITAGRAELVSAFRETEIETSIISEALAKLDKKVREARKQQDSARRNFRNAYARTSLGSFNVSVGHVQILDEGARQFDTELPRALAELDAMYRNITGHLPARPGRRPDLAAAVARELERLDAEAADPG